MSDDLTQEYESTVRERQRTSDDALWQQLISGPGGQAIETPLPPEAGTAEQPGALTQTARMGARAVGDVARGVPEIPKQALGGARDAFIQAGRGIEALGGWLRAQPWFPEALKTGKVTVGEGGMIPVPSVGKPETVTGGVARSAAQFLTGFLPFFKAARAVGIPGEIAQGMAAGAAADLTVFDPHDPRVSNLINDLAPALRTPVTEYLAAKPEDTEAEGRFKNAVEGLGLGAATEGILAAVRLMRAARAARVAEGATPAGKRALLGAERKPYTMERLQADFDAGRLTEAQYQELKPRVEKARRPLVQVTEETQDKALKARVLWGAEEKMDPLQITGKTLDINFDRINAPDDVKEALAAVTRLYRDKIDKARRGVRSVEETKQAAEKMGMTVEDLINRRAGQAMNAEEAYATRQILVASARKLRGLADEVAAGRYNADQEFLHQFAVHAEIQAQAAGVRAEAGRALQQFAVDATGEVQHLSRLGQVIETLGTGVTAQRLAGMVQALESPEQIAKFAREVAQPSKADMLLELWINSLLSGPQTHIVNAVSNALATLWTVGERALASRLPRASGEIAAGEAKAMLYGLTEGWVDAMRLGWKALKEGEPSGTWGKIDIRHKRAITAESLRATGMVGEAADLLGEVVRLPGRSLMASDEFFKAVNYRMELHAQAYRQATSEGLEGPALTKRIGEIVADPPELVKAAAQNFALVNTFQQELGPAGKAFVQLANAHPALRIVLPFVSTPTNIVKFIGERTPLLARRMESVKADLAAGGARADVARAKIAMGTMTMLTTASLAAGGLVTGGGPANREARARLLETGWQPYSIRIGDTYYSYNRLEPIGALLGIAADYAELSRHASAEDLDELAAAAVVSFTRHFTSKTYLTGLSQALQALTEPERGAAAWAKSLAGSVVPTGVAQVERWLDPTVRETFTLADVIKSRIPGLSKDLPPRRDLFGRPIVLEGGLGPDLFSPVQIRTDKKDPVAEEIVRQGVQLSMPGKAIGGTAPSAMPRLGPERVNVGVELNSKEYDRFVSLAGNELKVNGKGMRDTLAELINTPEYQRQSDGPDGGKAFLIRSRVFAFREAARLRLLEEFPDLRAKVDAQRRAKIEALQPAR